MASSKPLLPVNSRLRGTLRSARGGAMLGMPPCPALMNIGGQARIPGRCLRDKGFCADKATGGPANCRDSGVVWGT
jgi:hypothetical protein